MGARMALSATMHHITLTLSDVDRGVYETLDLRVARHPSETARYMFTRVLAYALSYEEGIAFSKGGLSDTDLPPVSVTDPTGMLLAWIDVGSPSAERMHKASKAAGKVALYTYADLAQLRKEMATRSVHKLEQIEVRSVATPLLDALEKKLDRKMALEVVRTDGVLYVTFGGETLESPLTSHSLLPQSPL